MMQAKVAETYVVFGFAALNEMRVVNLRLDDRVAKR